MLKSSKKTAGKKKKALLSVCLAAALLITGAVAFMTATDSADNVFTVGNVKIDLTEPNWDEANAENIVSGQVIAKDPTVTNTGANDAYVYVMVEVPKVYKTDIVALNEETGKYETTEQSQYQLFDYAVNDGWTLIDSKVTTEADSNESYNYYLYAYDTSVAPAGSVTLFDEVKFANVTSNFINTVTGEEIVDLDINVTSYAIQSDFYGNEATDAASAWTLFANQNEWQWPEHEYIDLTTLNFMSDDEVVYSETNYVGAPVTMFFSPNLARTGYSFDWVDETTGETGYTGMAMPEEDTNMIATYTEVENNNNNYSEFLKYNVIKASDGHYYLSLNGINAEHENYPTENFVLVIPSSITFTPEGSSTTGDFGEIYRTNLLTAGQEYTLYVEEINSCQENYSYELGDRDIITGVVVPDSVTNIKNSAFTGSTALKFIDLPYGVKTIADSAFSGCLSVERINIPNSVTSIGIMAFHRCESLIELIIPDSVTSMDTFTYCTNLKTVVIGNGLTEIKKYAFKNSPNIETIKLGNNLKKIGEGAFEDCTAIKEVTISNSIETIERNALGRSTINYDIYYTGTEEQWNAIMANRNITDAVSKSTIHFNAQ